MKVIFTCRSLYTTIGFGDWHGSASAARIEACLAVIRSSTSARPSGYQFMPRFKDRTWDGYVRLYKDSRFPTGLLPHVREALLNMDNPPEIQAAFDKNEPRPSLDNAEAKPDMLSGITLRDYQLDAIRRLLANTRGVAKMATNSGKTEVIAALAKLIPGRCLVLTTKRELLHQTAERLSVRLQEPVGKIGDGQRHIERVTVGMIQTLVNDVRMVSYPLSCVMFDECHHLPSKQSQEVMMGLPAHYRYGFSGTPLHYDDLSDMVLIGATGPIIVEVTNTDLIEAGVSAMPYVDMYQVNNADDFTESWQNAYTKYIVHNKKRNRMIIDLVQQAQAKATLILVDRLDHGRILQEALPGSIFAHGGLPTEERKAILDRLRHGNGACVVATPIFDEGVDVPSVDLLVLAAGGETHIRLLQRIGRGMRRKDSNVLHVVDFIDNTNKYLLSHSKSRAELYEQEGFAVRVVEQ